MNIIIKRLKDYFLTLDTIGDGAKIEICYVSKAMDYLDSQRADGSWKDVDYYSTVSAANGLNWGPYLALDRMQAMAIAYQKTEHPGYHSAVMLDAVDRGLRYWSQVRSDPENPDFEGPWSVNWWEREIGVQLRFGRIGLFLRDELSEEAMGVITRKLQKEGAVGPGQNELWRTQNALYRALILGDAVQFKKVVDTCLTTKLLMQTGAESEEAIQPDYSFHGHGELFFNNGYGMALFRDMSFWLYILRDTTFMPGKDQLQLMADYMLKGTRWTIRKEVMEVAQGYTEISKAGYAGEYYTAPIRRMMELDPDNRAEYQVLLDNILGHREDNGLDGFCYMWTSAYAAQMKKGYGVNLRMDSCVIKGAEWRATWPEKQYGNLVFWTTAGAVTVVTKGDEYVSVYPAFNWRHTPGVTAPYVLSSKYDADISHDRAMGVSNGRTGAAAFSMSKDDGSGVTCGRIGYFFFEDEYVALGAGISSTSREPVHTTINQTKADSPVADSGKDMVKIDFGTREAAFIGRWAYNNNIGYIFPEKTAYRVSHIDQNGEEPTLWGTGYSQFSIDGIERPASYRAEDVFSLWLDHGKGPVAASYAYIVLPDSTVDEVAVYAKENPITILVNSEQMQAVRNEKLHQTQIHFYEAGEIRLDEESTLSVSRPCEVILDESGVQFMVSAAIENNSADHELTVTLKKGDNTLETMFSFPDAPCVGMTQTRPFESR